MTDQVPSGEQDRLTLRFLDAGLEARYQDAAGAESAPGYRLIALATVVIWALAAFVVPLATGMSFALMLAIGSAMSLLGLVAVALSGWATTLDRQHAIATLVTIANGIVLMVVASIANALPGYGAAGLILLLVWGFVSRTRFVYAALRTGVLALAFLIAIYVYPHAASFGLDLLFFGAAAVGALLALRLYEINRRRLYFQDLVIRRQSEQLEQETAKSERLILNILPAAIATRLRDGERPIADDYPQVSVLFGDIVDFTPLSAQLSAHQLIEFLSGLFSSFDELAAEHGVEKIKTIGDNYMAVGGLWGESDHASRIIRLGLAMIEEMESHQPLGRPLQLRIGVHSGPVAGGVIGSRKFAFDLWGDTVNVASRLQELGPPGRVHVSEATWLLVRDEFDGEAAGAKQLRGHSAMATYLIARSDITRPHDRGTRSSSVPTS